MEDGGVPGQGRRGSLDTWPTPAPGAPARRRRRLSGSRCLGGGNRRRNICMRCFNFEDIFSIPSAVLSLRLSERTSKAGGTGVVRVAVDNLQEGDFGKSWFPEASFGR